MRRPLTVTTLQSFSSLEAVLLLASSDWVSHLHITEVPNEEMGLPTTLATALLNAFDAAGATFCFVQASRAEPIFEDRLPLGWSTAHVKMMGRQPQDCQCLGNRLPSSVLEYYQDEESKDRELFYPASLLRDGAMAHSPTCAPQEKELMTHVCLNKVGLGLGRMFEETAVARSSHIDNHNAFGSDPGRVLTVTVWCSALRNVGFVIKGSPELHYPELPRALCGAPLAPRPARRDPPGERFGHLGCRHAVHHRADVRQGRSTALRGGLCDLGLPPAPLAALGPPNRKIPLAAAGADPLEVALPNSLPTQCLTALWSSQSLFSAL